MSKQKQKHKQILFSAFLLWVTFSIDCQITAVVTFDNCMSYCYNTYGSKKSFFNYTTNMCTQTMVCPTDQYLVQYVNLCRNQFDPFSYEWDNYKAYFQDPALFSIVFNKVFNGYFNSKQIVCYYGWKSSNHLQKINQYAYNKYYCDLELKDGQIYPQTHGQYFFNLLPLDQQNQAMDMVFQYELPLSFFSILFLSFCFVYLILNIYECIFRCKKGIKLRFCQNRSQELFNDLDKKNKEQLQQFIKKRDKKEKQNNKQQQIPQAYKILTNFSQQKQKIKNMFTSEKDLKRNEKKLQKKINKIDVKM